LKNPKYGQDIATIIAKVEHMNMMSPKPCPGDTATARQLFELATQFHRGAEALFADKAHAVPSRLLALQAIEGYLIAFVRHVGRTNDEVRLTNHDVVRLADIGADNGLALRSRLHGHLVKITKNREYLIVRYGPEVTGLTSQTTELQATMNELSAKVGAAIGVKP
jgi:hypothetical protein